MSLPAPLHLAELGYAVFPCRPTDKTPLTANGVKNATRDADQIQAWLDQHPNANWAIATAGLLVVDIDGPANPWLADQGDKLLDLAAGMISLTPSGGRHYFTRQPSGASLGNTVQKIAPKVDTRANGGYVVCAPSSIGGKPYRWAAGEPVAIGELPETPAWLLALLAEQPARAPLPAVGNLIPAGQRNSALASLAGSMRNRGMLADEIAAALQVANANRCQPPLPADEVERIAASIARYEPKEPEQGAPGLSRPILVNLGDVTPRPVDWLWQDRIARGTYSVIAGEPGLGKSYLTMDLAARVSRGLPLPDGKGSEPGPVIFAMPGSVVLLSAEDDLAFTIRPRLDAAEADVSKITALQGVRYDTAGERCFSLEHDLPALEQAIDAQPDCRLVIIDPVAAYCGKIDSHNDVQVRGLIAPLSSLANKRNVAVVCVMHLNKSEMRNAINRVSGSIAFVGAARAAWLVTKDKSNAERRLFLQVKNNLAPDPGGLAFSIVDGAVKWESGIVAVSANDALSDDPKKRGTPAYVECCGWLADKLQSGSKVPAEEIFDEGENSLGFSRSTIKKAKEELGIEAVKEGFGQNGRWVWFLPCSSLSGEPDPAVAA